MKKILLLMLMLVSLVGCSETTQEVATEVIILDAVPFSKVTSEELVKSMGEPEEIEDYEWSIPATGEKIVGKLYIYEKGRYEFLLFDDVVARLSAQSGAYWGYDDSTFTFNSGSDVLASFGIIETDAMKRTVNTGFVEKYRPVAEGIEEVEIHDINTDTNTFGLIRITYDNSFFD